MNDNSSAAMVRAEAHTEIITIRQGTPSDFGEEHMRIVRESFAPTASEAEFQVLWAGAKSRGLDPVRKQIHFVKRYDKAKNAEVWSSQVSIDGFRSIADSTGKYDGQDKATFTRDPDEDYLIAEVRVYRKDVSRAFVGEARWPEFVQTKKDGSPSYMWEKMPYHMLGKCAEALALRKAFPEQLAGLYTPDEMGSDERDKDPPSDRGRNAAKGSDQPWDDGNRRASPPPAPSLPAYMAAAASLADAIERAAGAGFEAGQRRDEKGYAAALEDLRAWMRANRIGQEQGASAVVKFRERVRESVRSATLAAERPTTAPGVPGDNAGAAS